IDAALRRRAREWRDRCLHSMPEAPCITPVERVAMLDLTWHKQAEHTDGSGQGHAADVQPISRSTVAKCFPVLQRWDVVPDVGSAKVMFRPTPIPDSSVGGRRVV